MEDEQQDPRAGRFPRVDVAGAHLRHVDASLLRPTAVDPAEQRRLDDLVLLRRVRDRMDREFAQPLDVAALARGVHWSAGHLSRQFKQAFGESPYAYLMTRRIERAMALLRRGDLSVTDVCFEVGFSSLGTFSTRFTQLVGVPPSTYREQQLGATSEMPSCHVKQVTRPLRTGSGHNRSGSEKREQPGPP